MFKKRSAYAYLICMILAGMVFQISAEMPTTGTTTPTQSDVSEDSKPEPIVNYSIQITEPLSQQTFQSETDSIKVTVSVTPALKKKDGVILIVDGVAVGEPIHSTTLTLPRLDRGSHKLQARVIQHNGPGAESQIITIYQQRASALLRPHNG